MSDLMNIGRSGLVAYRTALGVVGENIANVDTKGYLRRDTLLAETGVGGGVDIVDVTRAFDALLVDRNRTALTNQAAAQTHLTHLRSLEERLLPGVDGVQQLLDGFFNALDGVALAPSDPGLRYVVLSAAETLAGGVRDLAGGLDRLAQEVQAEQDSGIGQMNAVLTALAKVQNRIAAVDQQGAQNPLFDQRDRLLDDLAGLVQINVTLDDRGMARVRLGADGAGPVLLDGDRFAAIDAAADGQIRVIQAQGHGPAVLRVPAGGVLGGLAQAAGSVMQTIRDIDGWATQIATQMNELHAGGLTPDGAPGGVMFTTTGWTQTAGALMRGDAVADLAITDISALPAGPLTLVYAADTALWNLRDAAGTVLATGNPDITAAGLQITLRGTARDGDRIMLDRVDGAAKHLAFALRDARAIAAAGPLIVSAAPANRGTAQLSVQPVPPMPAGLVDLSTLLAGTANEFLTPGVVGILPAGSGTVALSVQPRLTTFEFAPVTAGAARGIDITTATGTVALSWPAGLPLSEVVTALNTGALTDADGLRLRDLGLTASLRDGAISLMVDEGGTPPLAIALVTTTAPVAAVKVADESPAADLSVFTRDGRQLSGPLLSATAAAALLTPANGFYPGAVYQSADRNRDGDFAGLARLQAASAGDYSTQIGAAGGLVTWSAGMVPPEQPAAAIRYEADGWLTDLQLPAGTNAARRADLLAAALPVSVKAETRVALDLPAAGLVSMRVAGTNVAPVQISADLGAGGAAALANAVNAVSASTGIRAELSRDGARVMLVQRDGVDIALSELNHSAGAPVSVQRVASDGTTLASATLTTQGDQAVRVAGTIRLNGVSEFAVTDGDSFAMAQRDPFVNGLIDLQRQDAGSTVVLRPQAPVGEDAAPRQITIAGGDGRLHSAAVSPVGRDPAQIAASLLRDLRSTAPTSLLTGAPVPALPPDGASLRVTLGDQLYRVQMVDGAPVVSGPEADRISASFDATNRLVLQTADGALDGAALQLPPDAGEAARFGLGSADTPVAIAQGRPFDPADLPAQFMVTLGAQSYQIDVTAAGVTVAAGFPGDGVIDPQTGAVSLRFDARAGQFGIPAQVAAAQAGFDTADLRGTVNGDQLVLTATDGRLVQVTSPADGTGGSLSLANRPDMDLLVLLTGDGALRLSGAVTEAAAVPRAQEIRVLDADLGRLGLFDTASGAFVAERTLSADGTAQFGAFQIALGRGFATGDVFHITPNSGLDGDNTVIEAMANLRQRDMQTGAGGFGANFATMQQRVGGQVAAGQMRVTSLQAESESAARALANRAGVDLDAEAARMMQLQQAYQANAQSVKTARDLFETLLAAL